MYVCKDNKKKSSFLQAYGNKLFKISYYNFLDAF